MKRFFSIILISGIVLSGVLFLSKDPIHSNDSGRPGKAQSGSQSVRVHAKHKREFIVDPGRALPSVVTDYSGSVVATNRLEVMPSVKSNPDAIAGEYILSFYDKNDLSAFIELALASGAEILDTLDIDNAVRLRTRDRMLLEEILKKGPVPIERSSNYYVRVPDDPEQTPMSPESGYVGFGAKTLSWLGGSGDNSGWGSGVTVAILDTGVMEHPALKGLKIERLSLLGERSAVGEAGDYLLHGTAVASLIAGRSSDVQGIAPGASILSIQVMGADGAGDTFTLAKGIITAVDKGVKVINMSLGTGSDSFILKGAVDYALANNVMIIASVGNDAVDGVLYPAGYDGVVGVSGVDAAGRHLYFANRGASVDVSAPAYAVSAAGPDNGIQMFSGTSAAAAIVSGSVTWILSAFAPESVEQTTKILLENCNDTDAPGRDDYSGYGILNLKRIADRSVAGINDIAVCTPFVKADENGRDTVIMFIQNRGTESLRKVQMDVEIDGVVSQNDFYNIAVGEVKSREFIIDPSESAQGVRVYCSASIVNGEDIYPANNIIKGSVLGKP